MNFVLMMILVGASSSYALPLVQIAECHSEAPSGFHVQILAIAGAKDDLLANITLLFRTKSGNVAVSQVADGYYQDASGDFQLYIEPPQTGSPKDYKISGRFSDTEQNPGKMVYFQDVPVECDLAGHP